MHEIQKKLLALAQHDDIANMSLRKVGQRIGVTHAAQVKHHLQQLITQGYLSENAQGKFVVAENLSASSISLLSIPLMGEADCGEATKLASGEIQGYLSISPRLTRCTTSKDLYALRARGDSMNQADIWGKSIDDSDYVLVKNCDTAEIEDGDYVVSIIDGLANIKKFKLDKTHGRIVLSSESIRPYPPIIIAAEDIDSYQVAGKVVDVIKGVDHL
jgi:repressor LexA